MTDMHRYKLAVIDAYDLGELPLRLARKLLRCRTPKDFYICLEANGYMGDVWDALDGKDKYPWNGKRK